MNKKIIVASMLMLFCWQISGQENEQQPSVFRRHEIGLSVGKDNAANFELGFGTQGILNVGYSLKF